MPKLELTDIQPSSTLQTPRKVMRQDNRRCLAKRVWIDLDNSPHVPFFAPIIEELERAGHSVIVTARDCFQTCELAELLGVKYRRIGRHYGKNTVRKLIGLGWRAVQLLPLVVKAKPDVALSHGSRSQLLVANLLRMPSVTVADYEFAKIWRLVRPTWVITPEIIPSDKIHCSSDRIFKYPGIKEDVYVPRFKPDPAVLPSMGLDPASDLIVLIRPPATEAHYHRPETDELFKEVLRFLTDKPAVKIVLLPRNENQAATIRTDWASMIDNGKIVIPTRVTDGLNLVWFSDLVISGGGTMNREAAALGVPVYSIFRGEIGSVDRYLASLGRLILIERVEDVAKRLVLRKRDRLPIALYKSDTLKIIVAHLTSILSKIK